MGIPTEDLKSIASILAAGYLRHRDHLRRAKTSVEVAATAPLEHRKIARLAYSYWEARGIPVA